MTIHVTVKNEDSRETAVIGARVQSLDSNGIPYPDSNGPETELKGGPDHTGECADLYVHSGQQIVVREIRQ
jgi:hypothetical protein